MSEHELIAIIDDDRQVREALVMLLNAHDFETRSFASARELVESGVDREAACLILDLKMPEVDGLELQQLLNANGTTSPVIFLSGHGDVSSAVRAMRHGALTFLQKPVDQMVLLEHIREALALNRAARERAGELQQFTQSLSTLTAREHEVMGHVVQGQANKRIAAILGISERTVEVHRGRLMQKLGTGSVAELTRLHTLYRESQV